MAEPEWVSVHSSNLDAARYDKDKQSLDVRFKNGRVYSYVGVPVEVVQGLLHADSPGKFFHANIKAAYEQTE